MKHLVGTTKIELTDVNTGEVEVHEEHNTITDYIQRACNVAGKLRECTFGSGKTAMDEQVNGGFLRPLNTAPFDQLNIFDVEQENCYATKTPVAVANRLGHRAVPTTDYGTFNTGESVFTDESSTYVYDFTTSQANGTIASICLSNSQFSVDTTSSSDLYSVRNSSSIMWYPLLPNGTTYRAPLWRGDQKVYKKGSKTPYDFSITANAEYSTSRNTDLHIVCANIDEWNLVGYQWSSANKITLYKVEGTSPLTFSATDTSNRLIATPYATINIDTTYSSEVELTMTNAIFDCAHDTVAFISNIASNSTAYFTPVLFVNQNEIKSWAVDYLEDYKNDEVYSASFGSKYFMVKICKISTGETLAEYKTTELDGTVNWNNIILDNTTLYAIRSEVVGSEYSTTKQIINLTTISNDGSYTTNTIFNSEDEEISRVSAAYTTYVRTYRKLGNLIYPTNWFAVTETYDGKNFNRPSECVINSLIIDVKNNTYYHSDAFAKMIDNPSYYSTNYFRDDYQYLPILNYPDFIFSGSWALLYNTQILSTVNNLSSPVTKTSDKTMKITYTISYSEEDETAENVEA